MRAPEPEKGTAAVLVAARQLRTALLHELNRKIPPTEPSSPAYIPGYMLQDELIELFRDHVDLLGEFVLQ